VPKDGYGAGINQDFFLPPTLKCPYCPPRPNLSSLSTPLGPTVDPFLKEKETCGGRLCYCAEISSLKKERKKERKKHIF
jgi:hypothetical protein